MARTIRTIEAVASSSGMEVDRKAGIIHGVKILGLVSDNNRKYMPEAVRKAKSLYEGIKVNIDHPAESGDVRSAEDRFGKLINVEYVEGEGLYGDLMFLKSHPMAERICEAAERNDMNDTFGLSHNAQGDGQEDDDGCFVVSSIVEVRHVDLVADPATTKSLREARTRMKAIKEATDFDAIKRFQDTLKNATTKQVLAYHIGNTGGKIKSKDYTAAEVGGKQAMIGDILRSKFGSKAVEEFFAQEKSSTTKRTKESDMPDDEDKEMTEATNFDDTQLDWIRKNVYDASKMGKVKTLAKTAQAAISEINKWLMGANQNHSGPKTAATFSHYRDALTSVPVNSTLSDLANLDPSKYINNDAFSESKSKMKEAEDMDDEDETSEEEMTESSQISTSIVGLEKQFENAVKELHSINAGVSGFIKSNDVGPKTKQKFTQIRSNLSNAINVANKVKTELAYMLHPAADGSDNFSEAEGDPEDDMPMDEADGMSIDDITDKPSVEAYDEEDDIPMDEADDEEKMAMEGSSDNVGKTSREWDAHFEKQSPKMQSAINVGLHRGLSYPDAAKRAKSLVKEAIGDDEEDKMTMESKRRRLNTFCRNNGVTLTEGLYKDLRLLPDIAQRRCILRIKLASKARKPRSSGSMMPMTESKVHTGDNVFNWLRS
jgi:hypothetical protein